jgi:hypothetical protein
MSLPAFEVDKKGLSKILARRGVEFAVLELVQNALDENVTRVVVTLESISTGYHRLSVLDDCPEGFADLSHAYTLFAESAKKSDPEKRGRFNLGEKLVLAVCRTARITSTKGGWLFEGDTRARIRKQREFGSEFEGEIRMTKLDAMRTRDALRHVIVPKHVTLVLNGTDVERREPIKTFEMTLPTEKSDEDGYLRPTQRKCKVSMYAPLTEPQIYEMGIPVVGIDCQWDIDIQQKVPLNVDRDNVTAAYLRKVRAEVLNQAYSLLEDEDAKDVWVDDAMESKLLSAEATNAILDARYGEKRVIADPSDPEGTKLAVSQGFAVIHGGTFSSAQWDGIKRHGAILPAGQVTPSPKPFSDSGPALKTISNDMLTVHHVKRMALATWLAQELMGVSIQVTIANDIGWPFAAAYGDRGLILNQGRLGKAWFRDSADEKHLDLLLHEFGHEYSSDHLSSQYYKALTRLGGKLAMVALHAETGRQLREYMRGS